MKETLKSSQPHVLPLLQEAFSLQIPTELRQKIVSSSQSDQHYIGLGELAAGFFFLQFEFRDFENCALFLRSVFNRLNFGLIPLEKRILFEYEFDHFLKIFYAGFTLKEVLIMSSARDISTLKNLGVRFR